MNTSRIVLVLFLAFLSTACTLGVDRRELVAKDLMDMAGYAGIEPSGEEYYLAGNWFEEQQKPAEALRLYQLALESDLQHEELLRVWHRMFCSYQRLEQWGDAANALERLIELDASWTQIKIVLDVIDEEEPLLAIRRYNERVLPHLEANNRELMDEWLSQIEGGTITLNHPS